MSRSWIALDASGEYDMFWTEEEALVEAAHRIEMWRDSETWDEEVESVIVARVTHVATRVIDHVRPDGMDDDEWYELTGDEEPEGRTWWGHYVMSPVETDQ